MSAPRRRAALLVQRQLDRTTTGNAAYLIIFLRCLREAGLAIDVIFAPRRSFGNRPWARLHPTFAALIDAAVWPGSVRFGDLFISISPVVWGRFAIRLAKEALRRVGVTSPALTGVTSMLGHEPDAREARELADAANARDAALTIAEYSSLGPVLPLCTAPERSVLLHDLHSLRAAAARAEGRAPDHFELSLEAEAARCAGATSLVYASAEERATLEPLTAGMRQIWMRPDVNIAPPEPEATPSPPRAVFLGTRHAFNSDALVCLLDAVWPAVRRRAPDAQLQIVGSIGEEVPEAQNGRDGVTVLGRVDDLRSIGGPSAIGLAPTRLASGVSIKVAEYLRLGMAVVTLPKALEGFGDALDDLVARGADVESFADEVAALLADAPRRREMAARGAAEVGARLSNDELLDYLREIARG